jgi:hypothetical protein
VPIRLEIVANGREKWLQPHWRNRSPGTSIDDTPAAAGEIGPPLIESSGNPPAHEPFFRCASPSAEDCEHLDYAQPAAFDNGPKLIMSEGPQAQDRPARIE